MSKRKQRFDNLLEDYSCPSERPFFVPEKADRRKRTTKRRGRSEAEDGRSEVQRNYGRFDDQPTDRSMSDGSETDEGNQGELYRSLKFYSVEHLKRLRDANELREESASDAMGWFEVRTLFQFETNK